MNNRYFRKIALVLPLLAALFCACSQADDCPAGESGRVRRPLGVASLSAPADALPTRAATDAPQTRAATITPLPTDGEVGFFMQANAPLYSEINNRKGVYKADENLWLPTDSIWLTGVAAKLALYYPYDAAQTTAGKLNLASAVRTDDTKDLWSTRFEADSHTKDISLTLTQLYSRLSITFVKLADAEYTGTSALTGLKLAGAGIYSAAIYTLADGKYTYGTAGYTATLAGVTIKGTNAAADDATRVDLLLPPYAALTEDITLTATVDTKEMKIIIPKAKLSNTLAAGKQYNITLKLKPTALVLGSIKTTDWDSQTAWDEGVEFVPPPPAHSIDIGLDFYIADGNLTATKESDGSLSYAFADEQGYYSGEADGGDYFCWNTIDPFAFSVTQSSWDDGRDPCRKVGDGNWHTPTDAELQKMIDAGNVWGIYTMIDATTKNGRYFGTTTVPAEADRDKYVFLPAAGYRDGSNYYYPGAYGSYWSATLDTSNTNSAYYLYFHSSKCYVNNYYRYNGFSLRCVHDK